MPSEVPRIVFFTPRPRTKPLQAPSGRRDQLKLDLRRAFNASLEERTNIAGAHMSYTIEGYARHVVRGYKMILVGWPTDEPFVDLSDIKGGLYPLQLLQHLWDTGKLRFECASEDDIKNAQRDPSSVHPNPHRLAESRAIQSRNAAPERAVVVLAAVHHPADMELLGYHPTSTQPSKANLGSRARCQRSDVKRPHGRNVPQLTATPPLSIAEEGSTGSLPLGSHFDIESSPPRTYRRPRPRPRKGVTSKRCVVDSDEEGIDERVQGPSTSKRRRLCLPVDDPLHEFLDVEQVRAQSAMTSAAEDSIESDWDDGCSPYEPHQGELEEIDTSSELGTVEEEVLSEIEDWDL